MGEIKGVLLLGLIGNLVMSGEMATKAGCDDLKPGFGL